MAVRTVIEAIREGMDEELERDPSVFIIGEDVGKRGGVFLATDGLQKKYGEQRVIDSPLAESLIVGVAIGAAVNGMRPIAEIQFADFIAPAYNQIVEEAARFCYRSGGDFNLPMVIRTPWGGGVHGAMYHSQSIEATFAHIPGLKVVAPGTPADAKGLLKAAVRDPNPVLFLEHKRTYRLVRGEVPAGDGVVPIGKAEVKRAGTDLSLIAYGLMLHHCLEVAEKLAADGVSAEVLDLRTIKPIDEEAILQTARKTGKVLVVHEDNRFGGIAAEVMAIIMERAFDALDAPVMRMCGPDSPAMPFNQILEAAFMPSVDRILARARELAAY
ncbi:MAG TPA: alpha-ketoacid dehydrogenase subunit beta [Candidatus Limnocylindrales bacterium]|nr:alpha-ketoacid dehydrogenase subunit beta [Candidatus Limnocylindrales bacterium]